MQKINKHFFGMKMLKYKSNYSNVRLKYIFIQRSHTKICKKWKNNYKIFQK